MTNYTSKVLLLAVSVAFLSQNVGRSRSAAQYILCHAPYCYVLLLAVPEAVLSHTKPMSRSSSVLLLAVPEAVRSHKKARSMSSTRS